MVVYHPENHLDISKVNEVIFEGIPGSEICNYPVDKIEYNPKTNTPIHLIKRFINIETTIQNGKIVEKSDYYIIELPKITNSSNYIKTGSTGGSNIVVKVIKSKTEIYPNTNNYKVKLDKKYLNVVSVRLLSTEIPNVSSTINSKNNEITWINEEDGTYVADKILTSDSIFLDTIDKKVLINNDNEIISATDDQIDVANNTCNEINSNTTILDAYKTLTSTASCSTDNSNTIDYTQTEIDAIFVSNPYYTPVKLFDPQFFLEDSYHKIGQTLVSHIKQLKEVFTESELKKYIPWEYYYGTINTDVPDYICYQIFNKPTQDNDTVLLYNVNSLSKREYVSAFDAYINDFITPINNIKYSSFIPQSISSILTTNFNKTYPLNSIYLEEGIYDINSLLASITQKMNDISRLQYSWKIRDWIQLKDGDKLGTNDYSQYPLFDVTIDSNGIINFHQFRIKNNYHSLQGKILDKKDTVGKSNMTIVMNEGYPELVIKNKGNSYITGDRITIKKCPNIENINSILVLSWYISIVVNL